MFVRFLTANSGLINLSMCFKGHLIFLAFLASAQSLSGETPETGSNVRFVSGRMTDRYLKCYKF